MTPPLLNQLPDSGGPSSKVLGLTSTRTLVNITMNEEVRSEKDSNNLNILSFVLKDFNSIVYYYLGISIFDINR